AASVGLDRRLPTESIITIFDRVGSFAPHMLLLTARGVAEKLLLSERVGDRLQPARAALVFVGSLVGRCVFDPVNLPQVIVVGLVCAFAWIGHAGLPPEGVIAV